MRSSRLTEWSWPRVLLAGLALAVLVGIVVALSTSAAAFGVYNPAWNGASGLGDLAEEAGTDTQIAMNTTAYERVDPNGTIAVVLSPNDPYSETDRARLRAFVAGGGTLVVAEDVGPVGNDLLATVGADTRFDGRPVRDERHYHRSPAFPIATNVTDAPETDGVEQVTMNHGTTLQADPAEADTDVLVRTSSFAYLDANRNDQIDDAESLASRPVVAREQVGNGTVIAISDPSLFINAMLEQPGNRQFARTLLAAHDRAILDYSGHGQQPPLSVALLTLRGTPPLQMLLGLVGLSAVLVWSRRPEQIHRLGIRGRQILRKRRRTHESTGKPVGGCDGMENSKSAIDTAADTGNGELAGLADGRMDVDTLATYLRREHPDWDKERVRRVITGVLARRREGGDDDRSG